MLNCVLNRVLDFVLSYGRPVRCCALVAGMLCAAAPVAGQERAAPAAGATVHASATIVPSIDAASFAGLTLDLARSLASDSDALARRGTLLLTTARPAERATRRPARAEPPPVARSFERFVYHGHPALRHTIAVLY